MEKKQYIYVLQIHTEKVFWFHPPIATKLDFCKCLIFTVRSFAPSF